jgi:hypothetical protein
MTIVAGFLSLHGAVLCSDSQESTQGGFLKDNVTKLNVYRVPVGNLMFAAAGTTGQTTALEQQIVEALQAGDAKDLQATRDAIQSTVIAFYQKHIWPSGQPSQTAALMVIADSENEWLLKTDQESTVVRCPTGACVGIGSKAAERAMRFLLPKTGTFGYDVRSLDQLIAIAAYVVWLAKETVDGCGGPTQLAAQPRGEQIRKRYNQRALSEMEHGFDDIAAHHGELIYDLLEPSELPTNALRKFRSRAEERMQFLRSWRRFSKAFR